MAKPYEWAKEIHAWADGAKIEKQHWSSDDWIIVDCPEWDNPNYKFRIVDPYRELKEAAKDPTKQIRVTPFYDSDGKPLPLQAPVGRRED